MCAEGVAIVEMRRMGRSRDSCGPNSSWRTIVKGSEPMSVYCTLQIRLEGLDFREEDPE